MGVRVHLFHLLKHVFSYEKMNCNLFLMKFQNQGCVISTVKVPLTEIVIFFSPLTKVCDIYFSPFFINIINYAKVIFKKINFILKERFCVFLISRNGNNKRQVLLLQVHKRFLHLHQRPLLLQQLRLFLQLQPQEQLL